MKRFTNAQLSAHPCRHCGHGLRWHVRIVDHMRYGDCEHPAQKGLCRCPGYEEAKEVTK